MKFLLLNSLIYVVLSQVLLFGVPQKVGGNAEVVDKEQHLVYVVPVKGMITKAQLYILRRGLKQAVANDASAVVLQIDTPGGELKTTLEMMEVLKNFKGETITFVKKEAISAGAYISAATDEIYFAPNGILGAAAVIQGTGAEIQKSAKQKIDSSLRAKVRSFTQEHRYRAKVVRAMMDENYELKIDGKEIKGKGELLTLTAQEAVGEYGEPPEKLFGAGIVSSVEEILNKRYGFGKYEAKSFELSWSEFLARWLNSITPILLGLGMLLLFIEFKTPGFGVFGIVGIVLLLIVFASNYVAGLAGYEEILVFVLGVALLGVEIFLFPGTMVAGLLGILLIVGSIIWALADIWPGEDFDFTFELLVSPITDLVLGGVVAIVGAVLLGRYVLKGWLWNKMVLESAIEGTPLSKGFKRRRGKVSVGSVGVAVTDMFPGGQVEIKGKRYEARAYIGSIKKGAEIEVLHKEGFGFVVREKTQ